MEENQDYKIGMSLLGDVIKEIDAFGLAAITLDMFYGDSTILSDDQKTDITVKVKKLLQDCDIIEGKVGADKEALASAYLAKGRLYALYMPAKAFPLPGFADHKKQAISYYNQVIELASTEKLKGLGHYFLGKLHHIMGNDNEAKANLEKATSLLTVDEPLGMEAAKELERLKTQKKGPCFIATEVYGSSFAREVIQLKRYRDDYLSKFRFGRWFIESYYRISPRYCSILRKSEFLRLCSRIIFIETIIKILKIFHKIDSI